MINEVYSKITEHEKFDVSDNAYLCHFFIMPPNSFNSLFHDIDLKDTEIHVGYFNKETNKIFSYKLLNEDIEKVPEQDVFKKDDDEIEEIKLDEIKINLDKVLEIVNKEINENFPNTIPIRTIIVLQKIKGFGLVWNITIMRTDFKALNIKVDASSGEIVFTSCEGLLDRSMNINKVKKDISEKAKAKQKPKSCNAKSKAVEAFKKALEENKKNNTD